MGFLDRFRQPAEDVSPADGDQLIVHQLRLLGADLSRPREVLHFVYFPTKEDAEDAAADLRGEGCTVVVEPSADADANPPNPWLAGQEGHRRRRRHGHRHAAEVRGAGRRAIRRVRRLGGGGRLERAESGPEGALSVAGEAPYET